MDIITDDKFDKESDKIDRQDDRRCYMHSSVRFWYLVRNHACSYLICTVDNFIVTLESYMLLIKFICTLIRKL